METIKKDRRPLYLWLTVLFVNISAIFAVRLSYIINSSELLSFALIYGLFLFVSVFPVLVSRSSNKWKRFFELGVIALLLSIIIYLSGWYNRTCDEFLCNLGPMIWSFILVPPAIIFYLFFSRMGQGVKKWSEKTFLYLLIILGLIPFTILSFLAFLSL